MVNICKCPNCDAPIEFNSELQKMTCEYCGNIMTVEEAESQLENYNVKFEDKTENVDEMVDMDVYTCNTCGAEVLTDEHTSATFCSYCGNPTLIKNRFEGVLAPGYVIPFKIDKKQAQQAYKNWINAGGYFTPKEFKSEAMLEKITGMYAPFWVYDYNGDAKIHATATKVKTTREGSYMCTYTSYYDIAREFGIAYNKIPADASEKLADNTMDLLEPFNYDEMVPFKMPYISGFYADKYSYDSGQMASRVENRIEDYIMTAARNTIKGYNSVNISHKNIVMTKEKADYVLFPIWIMSYKYNGKIHTFTMNGQTGKIVAERPKSKKLMFRWFVGIFAGVFAALMAAGFILGMIVV
ncbi:MAG: hypothetical protein J6L69_09350 [Lachnospiraceae bacterium]|nr:hypothetical protein [Lachnospiraceae bacterium]